VWFTSATALINELTEAGRTSEGRVIAFQNSASKLVR